MMWLEILVVLLLIVFNGMLAMAEMAVVSSNRTRLKLLADRGSHGARIALTLAEDPGAFLSTVQIGITLVGVLAGAFGGATLSEYLAESLNRFAFIAPYGEFVAVLVVVIGITFLSIVVGELVPKQLALRDPERVAAVIALPMRVFLRIARPAVAVLDFASSHLLALLGARDTTAQVITEEEVKAVIHEGARAGVLKDLERAMLSGVMRLADRRAELIMTERAQFVTVNLDAPPAEVWQQIRHAAHTRVIAERGKPPQVVGLLEARTVLAHLLDMADARDARLDGLLTHPPRIAPNLPATELLERLRNEGTHMLFVVDDADEVLGLITATDVLNTIVPGFGARSDDAGAIVARGEDSWLVDGELLIDELADHLGLVSLPADRSFDSVAGFLLWQFERLPEVGERVRSDGYVFEVVDMDGPRIDKVMVTRSAADAAVDDLLESG